MQYRQTGRFFKDVMNSIRLRPVWFRLARNELKTKYSRSIFGRGWIFLSFGIWAAGVGAVYSKLFGVDMHELSPYICLGFALWGYITANITESGYALVNAPGYIKQFNLPKQTYILKAALVQATNFFLSLLVCLLVLLFFNRLEVMGVLYAIPGICILVMVGVIHSFFSAYITPYFRDFPMVMGSVMSILFFLTPIIFTVNTLKGHGLGALMVFNPFYYLVEIVRYPLMNGKAPDISVWGGALAYMAVAALLAWVFCRHADKKVVYAL
ncbi:MAG: ABC transporter permease [Proteobacteria bacterium]|nr:ABC transporter permease [Pseudomonadota bacterium]